MPTISIYIGIIPKIIPGSPEVIRKKVAVIGPRMDVYTSKRNITPIASGKMEKIMPTALFANPTNCSAPEISQTEKRTKNM